MLIDRRRIFEREEGRQGFGVTTPLPPIQRGEGLGSFIGNLFRRVVPSLARKGATLAKKVINSKVAKDIGKKALDHALNTGVDVLSDIVDGKSVNLKEEANKRLQTARTDFSKTLRQLKRKKIVESEDDDDDVDDDDDDQSDSDDYEYMKVKKNPKTKKKTTTTTTTKKKKKKKKKNNKKKKGERQDQISYSVFH